MIDIQSFPILMVDAGNSRIKFRYLLSREVFEDLILEVGLARADRMPSDWAPIKIAVIASGLSPSFFSDRWPKVPIVNFSTEQIIGIKWSYGHLGSLGKDRAVNLLGSIKRFPEENLLVVSAGTCITFDFLSKMGVHLGGFIAPGLQMRFRSMHEFTHALPLASVENLDLNGPGTNTDACLAGGAVWGMVAEIQYHAQFHPFSDEPLRLVLTGGDAVFLGRFLKPTTFVAPDLIFEGLLAVLEESG